MPKFYLRWSQIPIAIGFAIVHTALGQSSAAYGEIRGLVADTSNASVPAAVVTLSDRSKRFQKTTSTNREGAYEFPSVPFGVYQLTASSTGFRETAREVVVTSTIAVDLNISLSVAGAASSVSVAAAATGAITTAQATMDKSQLDYLSVQNQATGLSDVVTRTTPGVASDANGFAHPLGEHADTSISIDNQPITDQQAKIFSNQISTAIVQSMEVITGSPPAEFGGKTSLLINVTTQSGLGKDRPFGSLSSEYGSFGTWSEGVTYGSGASHWGNFAALSASGSGRFLSISKP